MKRTHTATGAQRRKQLLDKAAKGRAHDKSDTRKLSFGGGRDLGQRSREVFPLTSCLQNHPAFKMQPCNIRSQNNAYYNKEKKDRE